MWIDTHCHPFADVFKGEEDLLLQRAREAKISGLVVVGFDAKTNRQALEIGAHYRTLAPDLKIWTTVGVHPCDFEELTDEELQWMKMAAQSQPRELVAIGETGLDYHHRPDTAVAQEQAFRLQIRLARELDLPVIVHSREAAEDTLRILIDEQAEKVIFHCYTYDYAFAKKVWDRGYYTSFSGVLTYPNAGAIREAATKGPEDLLLIETDCPFLAPQSVRGKRNEMAFLSETGQALASCRGCSVTDLANRLALNTWSVFDLGE